MTRRCADVALVTSSFLPRFGGVEEHVLNVARRLRDEGRRVVIWAADRGDSDVPSAVDGILVRYLPTPLPSRSARGGLTFFRHFPSALNAWRTAFRHDRPAVIHVQCFAPSGAYATALAKATCTPLVVSSHGETFMDEDQVFDRSMVLARALRAALRRADAVTACSRYVAEDLSRFGADPGVIVVVPNGVDEEEPSVQRPGWVPTEYLLGVGRSVEVKGFDLLIEAYSRLATTIPLVVAGDGPARRGLEELAARLGVADRVVFPGRLTRSEIVTVMAGATLLAVPSRVEAFGITVLEGWRAGIPVVVTVRGGTSEFVTDRVTGLVVDPTDLSALAAALREVIDDKLLAALLSRAGRREVAGYTWERVAAAYGEIYEGVTRRG